MKMKKILKIFDIIFLLIIPLILLFSTSLTEFMGYTLMVNSENKSNINKLLEEEFIYCENPKIILVESKYNADDIVKIVTTEFKIEEYTSNSESRFIKYMEEYGIDTFDAWNKIRFCYFIILAIVIFFKKLTENVDMFGKFEEKDN